MTTYCADTLFKYWHCQPISSEIRTFVDDSDVEDIGQKLVDYLDNTYDKNSLIRAMSISLVANTLDILKVNTQNLNTRNLYNEVVPIIEIFYAKNSLVYKWFVLYRTLQ